MTISSKSFLLRDAVARDRRGHAQTLFLHGRRSLVNNYCRLRCLVVCRCERFVRSPQGAISIYNSAIETEPGTTFTGNRAINGGGGIYCSVADAVLTGSSFSGNEAVWGGGEPERLLHIC